MFNKANVIVAREVAKRYAHEGVISIAVNPGQKLFIFYPHLRLHRLGNISSDLQRHLPWLVRKLSVRFMI